MSGAFGQKGVLEWPEPTSEKRSFAWKLYAQELWASEAPEEASFRP
jgi:hypothetical protein